jgi:release factor glutamine methyltransferase
MRKTYKEALKWASFLLHQKGIEASRLESELLLASIAQLDQIKLLLHHDDDLDENLYERYEEAVRRRADDEPLAYITGEKYFYGRSFAVNASVLIPRPETELIIEQALLLVNVVLKGEKSKLKILDLGTGSGNLAVTLALEIPEAEVWAVDISSAALETAAENALFHNVGNRIKFLQGDYFMALKAMKETSRFKLVVSNPPYISRQEMAELPVSVRKYEPLTALSGGEDGLDSYRQLLADIGKHVVKPAFFLAEIGSGQKEAVADLFRESDLFRMIGFRYDLAGQPRLITGLI